MKFSSFWLTTVLAAAMTPFRPKPVARHGTAGKRSRTRGESGEPGAKLARKASERRIAVCHP